MTLNRLNRLRKTSDFAAVRRGGRSWADAVLVLNARPNQTQVSRFGFTVSKRLGNAVERNRIRRRLKSAVSQTDVKCGWDLVLIARQRARSADYHALKASLGRLLLRAHLSNGNSERQGK